MPILLFTLTLPLRGAFGVGLWVFIFCRAAKNEPKKRVGATPLNPAPPWAAQRKPLRCSASLRKARLGDLGKCKLSVLFGTASKTDLAGGSMPDFGRTRHSHNEKGGVRLKTLLPNGRGTSNDPL